MPFVGGPPLAREGETPAWFSRPSPAIELRPPSNAKLGPISTLARVIDVAAPALGFDVGPRDANWH